MDIRELTILGYCEENIIGCMTSMDTQSILTIATPFLVFGALLAVLVLVWDR